MRSITSTAKESGSGAGRPLPPAGAGPNFAEAVIRGIEPHVTRALRRLDGFGDVILIGRILMDYGHGAIGIRGESVRGGGIVARAVNAGADGECRDDFAGLIIGNRHHTAAASAEEAMVRGIERHRNGLFAWCG